VREKEEIALGYLQGAIFIPMSQLEDKAKTLLPQKEVPIVVYCAAGFAP